MTPAQEWLSGNVGGYAALDPKDRQAIYDFALLWSLFEACVLECEASVPTIESKIGLAGDIQGIDLTPFEEALVYFRDRYFEVSNPGPRFESLWPGTKKAGRERVAAVFGDVNSGPSDKLIALLIIVYRLRNNLFHGEKWANSFVDQHGNFTHAGTVLMRTMEMCRARGLTVGAYG